MTVRGLTVLLIVITIVALSVYDLYVYTTVGVDATISRVLWTWAQQWPVIPFLAGLLLGHLFFGQRRLKHHAPAHRPNEREFHITRE